MLAMDATDGGSIKFFPRLLLLLNFFFAFIVLLSDRMPQADIKNRRMKLELW